MELLKEDFSKVLGNICVKQTHRYLSKKFHEFRASLWCVDRTPEEDA